MYLGYMIGDIINNTKTIINDKKSYYDTYDIANPQKCYKIYFIALKSENENLKSQGIQKTLDCFRNIKEMIEEIKPPFYY